MHQAIPYRTCVTNSTSSPARDSSPTTSNVDNNSTNATNIRNSVNKMISENAVIVFGRRGCCMCHVVKRLLLGHGVNPTVFEVEEECEIGVVDELMKMIGEGDQDQIQFPVVFVGGKVFGGLEKVMATHISDELVPILKQAGALWL